MTRCAPRIHVAMLPHLLPADWAAPEPIALVIDTLRFTSTACVALAAGARSLHVVSDIAAARRRAHSCAPPALLCGERDCVRIDGFHLGNSPQEYTTANVAGRELVFSTTNGTRAVEAVATAGQVWLACLLNRRAISQALQQAAVQLAATGQPLHVWCVCAGTDGAVAFEDVMTAGAIIDRLVVPRSQSSHAPGSQTYPQLADHVPWLLGNDSAQVAWMAWQAVERLSAAEDLAETDRSGASKEVAACVQEFHRARGGRNLVAAGFAEDLVAVAQLDRLAWIPQQYSAGSFRGTSWD